MGWKKDAEAGSGILNRGKKLLAWAVLIAAVTAFPSCSLFDRKPDLPKMKAALPPPAPIKSDLPYTKINFDYPLSALTHPKLYVLKHDRRLFLVQDETLVRDYHIALGPKPNGDKYMRWDGRTPEGDFFICVKNRDSKYYKSLGINYPSPRHAEEALRLGAITPADYQCILDSDRKKCLPPWTTPLGGAIFIHGGGAYEDWTQGCVALPNSAMDELFDIVSLGTPVCILP